MNTIVNYDLSLVCVCMYVYLGSVITIVRLSIATDSSDVELRSNNVTCDDESDVACECYLSPSATS